MFQNNKTYCLFKFFKLFFVGHSISQTLHGTAIYAYIDPLAPPQLLVHDRFLSFPIQYSSHEAFSVPSTHDVFLSQVLVWPMRPLGPTSCGPKGLRCSSSSSRLAASMATSPRSTKPPGRAREPRKGGFFRVMVSNLKRSNSLMYWMLSQADVMMLDVKIF